MNDYNNPELLAILQKALNASSANRLVRVSEKSRVVHVPAFTKSGGLARIEIKLEKWALHHHKTIRAVAAGYSPEIPDVLFVGSIWKHKGSVT